MLRSKLKEKFLGSLLGAAIGDALGASREGSRMGEKGASFGSLGMLRYTDDTHMTIGVAESLIECRGFDGAHMARRFADNYFREPWRGYGPGPPRIFRMIKGGEAWDKAALSIYPGGSFGNGAAMRVAPIGLLFFKDHLKLKEVAYKVSLITHAHPLGIEGAILQALAVALATAWEWDEPLDRLSFTSCLLSFVSEDIYRTKLAKFEVLFERSSYRREVVEELGCGVEAFSSVPTAIFTFLTHSQDFASAISYAISLGGDTDTIASMTGAICGAYLGIEYIPEEWQMKLENREYILSLAERLYELEAQEGGEDG